MFGDSRGGEGRENLGIFPRSGNPSTARLGEAFAGAQARLEGRRLAPPRRGRGRRRRRRLRPRPRGARPCAASERARGARPRRRGSRRASKRRTVVGAAQRPGPGLRVAAADPAGRAPPRGGVQSMRATASSTRPWKLASASSCTRYSAVPRSTRRDRLDDRLDAEGVELPVVERARGVLGPDPHPALLHDDRPGVDAGVGPEHRDAGLVGAEDDLPGDRRAAAVARQQRGMEAERGVLRRVERSRGARSPSRRPARSARRRATRARRPRSGNRRALPPEARVAQQREAARPRRLRERIGRAPAGGAYTATISWPARAGARARPCRTPPVRRARCGAPRSCPFRAASARLRSGRRPRRAARPAAPNARVCGGTSLGHERARAHHRVLADRDALQHRAVRRRPRRGRRSRPAPATRRCSASRSWGSESKTRTPGPTQARRPSSMRASPRAGSPRGSTRARCAAPRPRGPRDGWGRSPCAARRPRRPRGTLRARPGRTASPVGARSRRRARSAAGRRARRGSARRRDWGSRPGAPRCRAGASRGGAGARGSGGGARGAGRAAPGRAARSYLPLWPLSPSRRRKVMKPWLGS